MYLKSHSNWLSPGFTQDNLIALASLAQGTSSLIPVTSQSVSIFLLVFSHTPAQTIFPHWLLVVPVLARLRPFGLWPTHPSPCLEACILLLPTPQRHHALLTCELVCTISSSGTSCMMLVWTCRLRSAVASQRYSWGSPAPTFHLILPLCVSWSFRPLSPKCLKGRPRYVSSLCPEQHPA